MDNGEYVQPRSLSLESTEGGNGQRSYVKGMKTPTDAHAARIPFSIALLIMSFVFFVSSFVSPYLLFTTPLFTDVESLQNLSAYVAHFEKKALKIDLSTAASSSSSAGSSSSSSSSSATIASAPPSAAVAVAIAKKS